MRKYVVLMSVALCLSVVGVGVARAQQTPLQQLQQLFSGLRSSQPGQVVGPVPSQRQIITSPQQACGGGLLPPGHVNEMIRCASNGHWVADSSILNNGSNLSIGYLAPETNVSFAVKTVGDHTAIFGANSFGSGTGVNGVSPLGFGVRGGTDSGAGVYGSSDSGVGVKGVTQTGIAVHASPHSDASYGFLQDGVGKNYFAGKVGIGVEPVLAGPAAEKLVVNGSIRLAGPGVGVPLAGCSEESRGTLYFVRNVNSQDRMLVCVQASVGAYQWKEVQLNSA